MICWKTLAVLRLSKPMFEGRSFDSWRVECIFGTGLLTKISNYAQWLEEVSGLSYVYTGSRQVYLWWPSDPCQSEMSVRMFVYLLPWFTNTGGNVRPSCCLSVCLVIIHLVCLCVLSSSILCYVDCEWVAYMVPWLMETLLTIAENKLKH